MEKAEAKKTQLEETEAEENRLGTSGDLDNLKKYTPSSSVKDASHDEPLELDVMIEQTFNAKKPRRKRK